MTAIVNGDLRAATYEKLPGFNFEIPTEVYRVERHLLNPYLAWADKAALVENTNILMEQFIQNFKKFTVSTEIVAAGPSILNS